MVFVTYTPTNLLVYANGTQYPNCEPVMIQSIQVKILNFEMGKGGLSQYIHIHVYCNNFQFNDYMYPYDLNIITSFDVFEISCI